MRRILALAFLSLLVTSPGAPAQDDPKPGSREFFADLTERRAAAYIAGDRGFYDRLLSADFVMVGDNGAITKKSAYLTPSSRANIPRA
jgi:uncharacterized protein DUF4440